MWTRINNQSKFYVLQSHSSSSSAVRYAASTSLARLSLVFFLSWQVRHLEASIRLFPVHFPMPEPVAEMSDLEKIKAAQAARRTRRAPPSVAVPEAASAEDAAPRGEEEPALVTQLRQEVLALKVEMGSLRRNNVANVKKVSEERDMFAVQLAREQEEAGGSAGGKAESKKMADLNAQLRAARTRNTDLEEENKTLRDEVKQLNFRVQASRTLDAANDGYDKIVEDLVTFKLRCAQMEEEKEDLLRKNKDLKSTNAALFDANGDLETSRSQWVVQCAELEKEKTTLAERVRGLSTKASVPGGQSHDTSYSGSDLQELQLN